METDRIAVLMTSFNRCELTLASLASLFRTRNVEDIQLVVFLVDDGCTDGTGDAVRTQFPQVRVLQGDGTLFWNGGMRVAFDAAMTEGFDGYILLNDDTILYDDAVQRLIACARAQWAAGKPAIVVGSMRSPRTGERTYGGFAKRTRGLALWFDPVIPHSSEPVTCDTMNGNFVLIPAEIAVVVGNLEERFRHHFGDIDYGLRAKRAGFQVVVAPGYAGECSQNTTAGSWRDATVSIAKRWKSLVSPKNIPLKEWLLFTRRHYGWRWLLYAASPYLKTIASSILPRKGRRRLSDAALSKP